MNFTHCQNFPGSEHKNVLESNILKVDQISSSLGLHNMIFMSPGATRIKILREPVSGGSSRVLHEEFKGCVDEGSSPEVLLFSGLAGSEAG